MCDSVVCVSYSNRNISPLSVLLYILNSIECKLFRIFEIFSKMPRSDNEEQQEAAVDKDRKKKGEENEEKEAEKTGPT